MRCLSCFKRWFVSGREAVVGGVIAITTLVALSVIARADDASSTASLTVPSAVTPEFLPAPTAAEKRIAAALDQPTSFEFVELALGEALASIKDSQGIQIQLDHKALEDAGIDMETPVTRSVDDISLRSALRLLLGELGLAAIIQHEVLLVTTDEVASTCLVTRTYPVADLVALDSYAELTEAIQSSIKPVSWNESGGAGSLVPVKVCKSVVVSQTRDVHDDILQLLRDLRAAGKLPASK